MARGIYPGASPAPFSWENPKKRWQDLPPNPLGDGGGPGVSVAVKILSSAGSLHPTHITARPFAKGRIRHLPPRYQSSGKIRSYWHDRAVSDRSAYGRDWCPDSYRIPVRRRTRTVRMHASACGRFYAQELRTRQKWTLRLTHAQFVVARAMRVPRAVQTRHNWPCRAVSACSLRNRECPEPASSHFAFRQTRSSAHLLGITPAAVETATFDEAHPSAKPKMP